MIAANEDLLAQLNTVLTLAFVSSERIKERKTNQPYHFDKEAEESKKTKKKEAQSFAQPNRLELRVNEFKNYQTYHLLAKSQRLVGMFFAYLKVSNDIASDEAENKLADIMDDFKTESEKLYQKYQLRSEEYNDVLDRKDRQRIAHLINNTDLQTDCRQLIDEFSRKVGGVARQGTAVGAE